MVDRSLLRRARTSLRGRFDRGSVLSSVVIVVACGALLAAAFAAEGYRTLKPELHDAGVWLSREVDDSGRNAPAIGRENTQIQEVDVPLDLATAVDLFQADATVLVRPKGQPLLCSIDGRTAAVQAMAALPEGALVALGGVGDAAAAAVLDPATGDLWVAPADSILDQLPPATQTCAKRAASSADGGEAPAGDPVAPVAEDGAAPADEPRGAPATATVEGATHVVIGTDGITWVYVPKSGSLQAFDVAGAPIAEEEIKLPSDHEFQLTVVGRTPVVLDEADLLLRFTGGATVELDETELGGSPRVQQPGPERTVVVLATTSGLFEVPLGGGDPVEVIGSGEVNGTPADPLVLPGCSFGAWGGESPSFAARCSTGDTTVKPLRTDGGSTSDRLQLRTNRNKVVVNDLHDGSGYLLGEEEVTRALWSMAKLEPDNDDDSSDPTTTDEQDEEQAPPVAKNDTGATSGEEAFATRPGRAVVVHPMRNDYDANRDVLVIRDTLEDLSGCECLRLVDGGLAVQVTPPAGWLDDIRFRYTISDGTGQADASAESLVEIHEDGENAAPTLPPQATVVRSGATVRHNVLADARDPDGDAVGLVLPVAQPTGGGAVTAASDGLLTFTAPGGTAEQPFTGTIVLPFTITDGLPNGQLDAELTIRVIGTSENNKPTARGDHAVTVVNHEVVVDVLANDSDPDGDPLRITQPGSATTADVRADEQGRLHVTPHIAGPLLLTYSITDGFSGEVPGKVRVDVSEQSANQAPVAVRDDIVLPAAVAGSAETPVGVVDALANDFDPDGDVLVLEGVDVPESTGLAVEVIDHRFLRARATRSLVAPMHFSYSVTDGAQRASTTVVVRPGSVGEPQAPHAVDDAFTVRAGAVAALDVLRNDADPEGARLEILWDPGQNPGVGPDQVFVQDSKLRFQAPADVPSTPIQLRYSAVDPDRRTSNTATVQITVLAHDAPNRAPQPADLTARTLAGQEVVIPIPVTTMDPDGDDVALLGLAEGEGAAPQHGSVTAIGTDRLTYRPDVWTGGFWGTDTFVYRVRDAKGEVATGTIRVGVAAPPIVNHPPVAIDDIRQSGSDGVTIDVIRNDSDPDGDDLELVADSLRKTDPDAAWSVDPSKGRVRFDPKDLPRDATATFTYQVTDGVLLATGRVSITMTELVPVPPFALDDRVPATEAGGEVEWDALKNDIDPDGPRADLRITDITVLAGLDEAAKPEPANPVRFTMPATADEVVLRYQVTDAQGEGESAFALVRVRLASSDKPYPPSAVYDSASTTAGTPVSVKVLDNDSVTPTREKLLLGTTARPNGTCQVAGDEVVYTPDAGFTGWGGCSYVLGDGPGDSPDTLKAVGTVGVEVKADGNTAPRFVPQRLTIYADKEERTFSLRAAVVDADDPKQREDVCLGQPEGETDGISAEIDGTTLHLTAASGTPEGEIPLTFTVSDCTDDAAEPGLVTVVVSKYSGPLASLANDPIETTQKVPASLNVLTNDTRSGLDDPLTIVRINDTDLAGSAIPVGNGSVTAEKTGAVVFTPDPEFHGVTTFTYTVDDGTKDPTRFQTATVTVTVVGFPEPPPIPNVVRGNRELSLSWGVPADNGAPILGYLIEVTPGGQIIETGSPVSSKVVDGLTNSTPYQFRVAALNKANSENRAEAKWSELSPSIAPNTNPNQPAAPVARFDPTGEAIDVSWVDPGSEGSPVRDYELVVSPAPASIPGGRISPKIAGTAYHVTGLTNGTEYTFTVQAFAYFSDSQGADQPLESLVSPSSAPEIPAAPPDAPAKPTISPADLGDNNITVHWLRPADNGDAIATYHVEYFTGGVSQGILDVPGDTLQTTVYNTDNNKQYTFTVTAENKAGPGAPSPQSDPVNSSGAPGDVSSIASSTEASQQATLRFSEPPSNGAPITGYGYRIAPSGGWTPVAYSVAGTQVTIVVNGLANGGSGYQFQVRAKNQAPTGGDRWGSDANLATSPIVIPFGDPNPPAGLSGHDNGGSKTLTWNWSPDKAAQRNGHFDIIRWEVEVSGYGVYQVGTATYSAGVTNWGDCRDVRVRAVGDRTDAPNRQVGVWTGWLRLCTLPPSVTVSKGAAFNPTGCSAGCQRVRFTLSHWNATGSVRYDCYSDDPPAGGGYGQWWGANIFVGGDGTYDTDCAYGYPGGYVYVVVAGVASPAVRWGDLP